MKNQEISPRTIIEMLPERSQWGRNIHLFKELLANYPSYPGVLVVYSNAICLQNDENGVPLEESKTSLVKALCIDPVHLLALEELAHLSYAIYKSPELVRFCTARFLQLTTEDVRLTREKLMEKNCPVMWDMPPIDFADGQAGKYISSLNQPLNSPLSALLGEMHELLNRCCFAEALQKGRSALSLFPQCDSLLLLTSKAAIRSRDFDTAQKLLRECILLETEILSCVKYFGELYEQVGSDTLATLYQQLFLARAHRSMCWFTPMLEDALMNKNQERDLEKAKCMVQSIETKLRSAGEVLP